MAIRESATAFGFLCIYMTVNVWPVIGRGPRTDMTAGGAAPVTHELGVISTTVSASSSAPSSITLSPNFSTASARDSKQWGSRGVAAKALEYSSIAVLGSSLSAASRAFMYLHRAKQSTAKSHRHAEETAAAGAGSQRTSQLHPRRRQSLPWLRIARRSRHG